MKFRSMLRPLSLCLIISTSLLFFACSDDATTAKGKAKKNSNIDLVKMNPLVSKLPEGTYAFLTFNASSDSYKRYLASRWGKTEHSLLDIVRELETARPELRETMQLVGDLLEASEIEDKNGQSAINRALAFTNLKKSGGGFDLGIVLELEQSKDAASMLKNMEASLKSHQVTIEVLDAPGDYAVSLSKTGTMASVNSKPNVIHLAGKAHVLAASTNVEQLSSLLNNSSQTDTFKKMSETPLYKKSVGSLGQREFEYSFGYFDVSKILPQVKGPPIQLQSLTLSRQMLEHGPGEFVSAVIEPASEKERNYVKVLEQKGSVTSVKQFPKDTVAFFGLDMDVWSQVITVTLTEEERKEKKDLLDIIDALSDIAVGLKGSRGNSPFPEVIIGLNTDEDPKEVLTQLENLFNGIIPMSGINMAPWQDTTLEGVPVRFSMTPFGMGLYIGSFKKAAFVTTSKTSALEYIASLKGDAENLQAVLPKDQQQMLTDTNPIAVSMVNFYKLGTLIEVFQSNLSMFTGGQSVDQRSIENLKRAGMLALSLTYHDNVFQFATYFSEPKPEGSK